jgi:hypothetical protein
LYDGDGLAQQLAKWFDFLGKHPALGILEVLVTRISSSRYSMTTCWWWFIQPAKQLKKKGREFMA